MKRLPLSQFLLDPARHMASGPLEITDEEGNVYLRLSRQDGRLECERCAEEVAGLKSRIATLEAKVASQREALASSERMRVETGIKQARRIGEQDEFIVGRLKRIEELEAAIRAINSVRRPDGRATDELLDAIDAAIATLPKEET